MCYLALWQQHFHFCQQTTWPAPRLSVSRCLAAAELWFLSAKKLGLSHIECFSLLWSNCLFLSATRRAFYSSKVSCCIAPSVVWLLSPRNRFYHPSNIWCLLAWSAGVWFPSANNQAYHTSNVSSCPVASVVYSRQLDLSNVEDFKLFGCIRDFDSSQQAKESVIYRMFKVVLMQQFDICQQRNQLCHTSLISSCPAEAAAFWFLLASKWDCHTSSVLNCLVAVVWYILASN